MASLRLDPDLERRLVKAARKKGVSKSQFMRAAIETQVNETLGGESLYDRIKDVIGSVHYGGDASRAHEEAAEIAAHEHAAQRERWLKSSQTPDRS